MIFLDSILESVKKKLGIQSEYTHFDDGDIIDHINTAFFTLNQLGIGPAEPFVISDKTATWSDFIEDIDDGKMEAVKSYVAIQVRILFDPPSSSYVLEELKEKAREYEFRLQVEAEKDLLYPASMRGIYMTEDG